MHVNQVMVAKKFSQCLARVEPKKSISLHYKMIRSFFFYSWSPQKTQLNTTRSIQSAQAEPGIKI